MIFNTPERIRAITQLNPFERSDDGRGVLERRHGYPFQFEGGWLNLHPEQVLVGRAVTAMFVPMRPDLHEAVEQEGRSEGRSGGQNTWIIDTRVQGDVIVVDIFVKIRDGTFVGDNLSTTILARAGTGIVIHGGIRD